MKTSKRELSYRKAAAMALREVLVAMAEDTAVDPDLWWDTRHQIEAELAAIRVIEETLAQESKNASTRRGVGRG